MSHPTILGYRQVAHFNSSARLSRYVSHNVFTSSFPPPHTHARYVLHATLRYTLVCPSRPSVCLACPASLQDLTAPLDRPTSKRASLCGCFGIGPSSFWRSTIDTLVASNGKMTN